MNPTSPAMPCVLKRTLQLVGDRTKLRRVHRRRWRTESVALLPIDYLDVKEGPVLTAGPSRVDGPDGLGRLANRE
jgi:hypothetical protein